MCLHTHDDSFFLHNFRFLTYFQRQNGLDKMLLTGVAVPVPTREKEYQYFCLSNEDEMRLQQGFFSVVDAEHFAAGPDPEIRF